MPPTPKIGSTIKGKKGSYLLEELITEGNMSWALKARNTATKEQVFMKYYKSPTPTVSWYEDYLSYVAKLNRRLEESEAHQYCVLAQDLFTANPKPGMCPSDFFFSTYEFITGGNDMRKMLDSGTLSWDQRKKMAKVFLASMRRVHKAGVVHCDLKPENIQMLPDSNSTMGLIPRMIDMDFSIIENERAPWTVGADKTGYTGTPGYFSPEHLNNSTPTSASDVFTIGIILSELLANTHPFAKAHEQGKEAYAAAVHAGNRFTPVTLMGTLGDNQAHATEYAKLIELCFSPSPSKRPTCEMLHRKLLELDKVSSTIPQPPPPESPPQRTGGVPEPEPEPEPKPETTSEPELPPAPPKATTLVLTGDLGSREFRLSMDAGSTILGDVTSQARFCEKMQFHLEKRGDEWYISPAKAVTRNLTAVNGTPITQEVKLTEGDTVCLIGKASGKTAMNLAVSFK